jgi:hypothetical protein
MVPDKYPHEYHLPLPTLFLTINLYGVCTGIYQRRDNKISLYGSGSLDPTGKCRATDGSGSILT